MEKNDFFKNILRKIKFSCMIFYKNIKKNQISLKLIIYKKN